MTILDENIPEPQRQLLRTWHLRVRQIGVDISRKGIKDDEILPFLLTKRQPTFFTRDLGFYSRKFCHARYCLVCLAVNRNDVAVFSLFGVFFGIRSLTLTRNEWARFFAPLLPDWLSGGFMPSVKRCCSGVSNHTKKTDALGHKQRVAVPSGKTRYGLIARK